MHQALIKGLGAYSKGFMKELDKNPDSVERKLDFEETLFTDSDGYRTFIAYKGDEVISQTLQDVRPILRTNAVMRDNDVWSTAGDVKPYARIPVAMWMQWEALGITEDHKALLAAIEVMKDKVKVTTRKV